MENDKVNHPRHYTSGDIGCIDAIKAALTPEEFRGYCKGNAIKYTWREGMKGGNEDLKKAMWYMQTAVDAKEDSGSNPARLVCVIGPSFSTADRMHIDDLIKRFRAQAAKERHEREAEQE